MKQLFTKNKTTIILVLVLALIYFLQSRLVYAAEDNIIAETDDFSDGQMLNTGKKFEVKKGDYLGFIFSTKPTENGEETWRVKRKKSYFILNPNSPNFKRGIF